MSDNAEEDHTIYTVVRNHEEQYSIWPADRDIPDGWYSVGKIGYKEKCLSYIDQAWTDMRPLSLRKEMEADDDFRLSHPASWADHVHHGI
jgi:MbtH protein